MDVCPGYIVKEEWNQSVRSADIYGKQASWKGDIKVGDSDFIQAEKDVMRVLVSNTREVEQQYVFGEF